MRSDLFYFFPLIIFVFFFLSHDPQLTALLPPHFRLKILKQKYLKALVKDAKPGPKTK